jgi:Rieske Fe-S protein
VSENDESQASRREFCSVMVAGSLAAILQACGSGGGVSGPSNVSPLPVVNATASGNIVSVPIEGTVLATAGGAALVQSSLGFFLVARTATDTFVAVDAICTHERCTITGVSGQSYVCPCHGSQYSFSGQRQSGPAPRSLSTHQTTFENGVLMIAR